MLLMPKPGRGIELSLSHSVHLHQQYNTFAACVIIAMCRLGTLAEVLRDLDAEWEVADDVIVTARSLLHHPRPTTRQLVVLSEVHNRLRYGTRIVERLVASRFGPLATGVIAWTRRRERMRPPAAVQLPVPSSMALGDSALVP